MKVIKFFDFIKEELNDTPEQYVSLALMKLKKKIDKIFEPEEEEENFDEPQRSIFTDDLEKKPNRKGKDLKRAKEEGNEKENKEKNISFKDLGVRLESSEISKYSKLYDFLTVKFSDDESTYTLIIIVDMKQAIPKDATKDFSPDDIEKCFIKFKKYDLDTFDIVGEITKNIDIKKISEDFLVELKIEIDEEFGGEKELEIETEE